MGPAERVMDLKWLEDFVAVAETRSFSRAAAARHVTQPAFSRRIQALEAWIGTELIDRSLFPTTLTVAGQTFLPTAQDMLRQLKDTRATIRGRQMLPGRTIAIATSHTLSVTYFPRWLDELGPALAGITARVIATNAHDGMTLLAEGGCDLLLGYSHPTLPAGLDADRYPFLTIDSDRVVPLCAPDANGHPRYTLPGTAERPLPYLAYTPSIFLSRAVEAVLENPPAPPHLWRCYETDMAAALKAMMLAGRGVGWLPESAAAAEIADGRLVSAAPDGAVALWETGLDVRLHRAAANHNRLVERIWALLSTRHASRNMG